MGALPKPAIPAGAAATLFDELHALHHRAGWPSLRDMAREVGCSHTTVSAAFSEPRIPRWGLLELIVETLDGDTASFQRLWLAATSAATTEVATSAATTEAATSAATTEAAAAPQDRVGDGSATPRQLPADVVGFAARADELRELDRLLDNAGTAAALIAVVCGTAGVGKTALAVHWAHRVAARFPDGQLYVDLRGYDPSHPVQATEALEGFLRALGVAGAAIPVDPAERAARYRTLLADRRMLIVLDNANAIDQVRDLLPGTGSCFVVVTSRHSLPGLVARHGGVRINVDLLSPAEATGLLRTLVGQRVDDERDSTAALAERCARLPLALRLAAELAAARPAASLADLVVELREEPLEALGAGDDEHTAVRAVFSWSCRHLAAPADAMFQLLGLHPGRDFDIPTVAALAGADRTGARRLVGELTRAHLIEETWPGRFAMHDLLRAYAAERAAGLPGADRWAALGRLVDYYVAGAVHAVDRPGPEGAAWLEAERSNLIATAEAVAERFPAAVGRLSTVLADHLDGRARYAKALALHGVADRAAQVAGDRGARAGALNRLAIVYRRLGRYAEATDHHQRALQMYEEMADPIGAATALHGLGILSWRAGRYADGRDCLERALTLHREAGNRSGQGSVLYALGITSRRLGRYAEAMDLHQQSVTVLREVGDRLGEGRALGNLGVVYQFLERYPEAVEHHQQALAIHRELGDRAGIAVVLTNLGSAYERLARYPEALAFHQEALKTCREIGYRAGEGDALHGIGVVCCRLGRVDDALGHLRQAVEIGRDIGEADLQTAALIDLGETLHVAGHPAQALDHLRSALTLAERNGDRYEQARALTGLAAVQRDAADAENADRDAQRASSIYAELGLCPTPVPPRKDFRPAS